MRWGSLCSQGDQPAIEVNHPNPWSFKLQSSKRRLVNGCLHWINDRCKKEHADPRTRDSMESGKGFSFRDSKTILSLFPVVMRLGDWLMLTKRTTDWCSNWKDRCSLIMKNTAQGTQVWVSAFSVQDSPQDKLNYFQKVSWHSWNQSQGCWLHTCLFCCFF